MKRIVILGGGTGGTIAANRLRRVYEASEAEIVVVDQDDEHVYQPGLLFVPFGLADPGRLVRPRHRQLHAGTGSARPGSSAWTWTPIRYTSRTEPRSATTCWWSPPERGCCPRKPRA